MGKKMTNQEFTNKVFKAVGNEYIFTEEYQGIDVKIFVEHVECKNKYQTTPYHFLHRKQRCPRCNKFRKRTAEEFSNEFYKALGKNYTLLSEYKGARDKVLIKHEICGSIYEQAAHEAKRGKGCRKCAQDKFIGGRLKNKRTFEREFNLLSNKEYEMLSEYKNDNSKIKVRHTECGFIYPVNAGAFIQGRRCPKCAVKIRADKQRWTQEQFEEFVRENGDNEYSVLNKYADSQTKVKLNHLSCGHTYEVTPRDFVSGKRCPRCRASHGEKMVEKLLKDFKLNYKTQYRIEECKVKRALPFDFAVFKENKMILIEYQGIQHYQIVSVFGGEEGYKERVFNDNIKRNFCEENNIDLIEIPYYFSDEDIIHTIKQKLCQS